MADIKRARRHGLPGLRPRGARVRGLSLHALRDVHLPHLHLSRRDALPRVRRQGSRQLVTRRHRAGRHRARSSPSRPSAPSRRASSSSARPPTVLEAAARVAEGAHRTSTATWAGSTPGTARRSTRRTRTPGGRRPPAGARARSSGWATCGVRLPLRARVAHRRRDRSGLPDGRRGRLVEGAVTAGRGGGRRRRAPRRPSAGRSSTSPARPTNGAGSTPCGVDCSGLVQTTFLARGVSLPRDSSQQVELRSAGLARRDPSRRPALLPRRDRRAHHARRLRRRGGYSGPLDAVRAAVWCRSPGCRGAGPRRSASGSSP